MIKSTAVSCSLLAAIAAVMLLVPSVQAFTFPLLLLALAVIITRFWITSQRSFLLVVISALLLISVVEIVLTIGFDSAPSQARHVFRPMPYFKDEDTFYWAHSGVSTLASSFARNGETIYYDVPYVFDKLGRRSCGDHVPFNWTQEVKSHLLLFGCSYLFGEGLSSDKIVACNLEQKHLEMAVANYAKAGFGPSEAWMLLKIDDYFRDIKLKSGKGLFFFIGDHIVRTVGTLDSLTQASNIRSLNWQFNAQHIAVPVRAPRFFSYITKFRLVSRFFDLGVQALSRYIATSRDKSILITVDVLRQLKANYLQRFPSGSFAVIIWPRAKLEGEEHLKFIAALSGAGIEYLDIPYRDSPATGTIHPLDGHPSANENRYVAEAVDGFLSASTQRVNTADLSP